MESYTYLLVDFLTVIVCFIFSFHPRIQFAAHFSAFFKACLIVAVLFIIWDVWFTKIGVWWFNDRYLIGLRLFGLPIEELLFFICIPFSCIFTYFCIDKFFNIRINRKLEIVFVSTFILFCAAMSLINLERIYPAITFATTAIVFAYLLFIAKVDWVGKIMFVYGILLLPFFIVNGVLTGTGLEEAIVNYNPVDFMGIRILTVPIEDAFYGLEMVALNLYFFKLFQSNDNRSFEPIR